MKRVYKTKEYYKECKYCGEQIIRKRFGKRLEDFGVFKKRKYCNRECMRKDYLKIGLYKDRTIRNSRIGATNINKLLLKYDKCQNCGSPDNLDIHHIDHNPLNNNLDNLIMLCRSCHMKKHKKKDVCLICGKEQKGLGYCEKHYQRYKKHGNPLIAFKNKNGYIRFETMGYE